MIGLRRRLLRVFVDAGGDLADGDDLARLAQLVRSGTQALTIRTRRAVEIALEVGEEISHERLAAELSRLEGRTVTPAGARQRVSRGGRRLEASLWNAVRETSPWAGVLPHRR